jgi:Chlorite dismutase
MGNNLFNFIGGDRGQWKILSMNTPIGLPLAPASFLEVTQNLNPNPQDSVWTLKGFTSNVRYAEKAEIEQLTAIQAGLGRAEATRAALIPIRKNADWWVMAQDERRRIFENKSHHTAIGLKYLPEIARKLHHCRDIGEPFDFLTWFEYAPEHSDAFEDLVIALRKTEEWQYVDREIDIRLIKA